MKTALEMRCCVITSALWWESISVKDRTRTFLFLWQQCRYVSQIGVSLQVSQRTTASGAVRAHPRRWSRLSLALIYTATASDTINVQGLTKGPFIHVHVAYPLNPTSCPSAFPPNPAMHTHLSNDQTTEIHPSAIPLISIFLIKNPTLYISVCGQPLWEIRQSYFYIYSHSCIYTVVRHFSLQIFDKNTMVVISHICCSFKTL